MLKTIIFIFFNDRYFVFRHELNPSDPHYSFMTDGTLMVEKPKEIAPAGSPAAFSCMAKNPLGEAKSRVARMVTSKNKGIIN